MLALSWTRIQSRVPNGQGDQNGLEDPKNCGSASGHGNQYVRLRGAKVAASRHQARSEAARFVQEVLEGGLPARSRIYWCL